MTRILVCGGRDFSDWPFFVATMHDVVKEFGCSAIIHGDARGADAMARDYARANGFQHIPYPALWTQDGKSAGPIRNSRMLAEGKPDLVLAFPGGRGTADMVSKAHKAGVEVVKVTKLPLPT